MIAIRPMTMEDADFLLEMKNYPETRQFAIVSHEEIEKNAHYSWLQPRLNEFAIIEGATCMVGAMRITESKEISIWIDRKFWSNGIATTVLSKLPSKQHIAKIVDGNIGSFKAFIRAGFEPIDHINNYYILQKK